MSEDDNVIAFGSGKPVAVEKVEKAERKKVLDERTEESVVANKERILFMLNQAIKLVEDDKIDSLVIIGRNPSSGMFFSEIIMDQTIAQASTCYSFVGALEASKVELLDDAVSGPHMDCNGEYFGLISDSDVNDADFILKGILGEDDDDV